MSKYLEFVEEEVITKIYSKKTKICLGTIIFYEPWKQYVFEPSRYDSVFNDECLMDIISKIQSMNKQRKG